MDKSIENHGGIVRSSPALDVSKYDTDVSFRAHNAIDFSKARTTDEVVRCLRESDADIEARVMAINPKTGQYALKRMGKEEFLEAYDSKGHMSLRESDAFGTMDSIDMASQGKLGNDFIPLLGGPFYKQLYLQDMLLQTQLAFNYYHHDPLAHTAVDVIKEFTLGKGYRVDHKDKKVLALWRMFEDANELPVVMEQIATELSVYGEVMLHWLPGNATKYTWNLSPGQKVPKGVIPRVYLRDPSSCWEIVTYPEDIRRVVSYVFNYPTQYSMYTDKDGGSALPTNKYIYEHVPAEQMMHFKVNVLSNEKRGRSDLFPVFGHLKRMKDAINFEMIKAHKLASWTIDATVDGNASDIQNYIDTINSLGAIPDAGSEFVHSKKVERKYLHAESASTGGQGSAYEWNLAMICAGLGIPRNYLVQEAGHQARATAIVATEPVTKKFEMRQMVYERIIKAMARKFFAIFDMEGSELDLEVTFPEIITQDRSAKLKDLALAESQRWISPERAAEIASKELGITEFDFQEEQATIDAQKADEPLNPLTAPGAAPGNPPAPAPQQGNPEGDDKTQKPSGVSGQEKRKLSLSGGF